MAYRNYSPSNGFLVSKDGNGDFLTIQAAITACSAGTIYIRGTTVAYTEDLTLKPNVNLVSWSGSEGNYQVANVVIKGKCTMSSVGEACLSGIQLQTNGDYFLDVTNASSVVICDNCYLNAANNAGISQSNGNIYLNNCRGDIGGNFAYVSQSAGNIYINNVLVTNTGTSTTTSSISGICFMNWSQFFSPFATASTGVIQAQWSEINSAGQNVTALTTAGTGSSNSTGCKLASGTASCISIGAGTTLALTRADVNSTNTNAITGAGTLNSGNLTFTGSSNTINTTTQTAVVTDLIEHKATKQPCFAVYLAANAANATGDGTTYPLAFDTEQVDQGGNFAANVFTAPIAGNYRFDWTLAMADIIATHTGCLLQIMIAGNQIQVASFNPFNGLNLVQGSMNCSGSILIPMNATDTAYLQVTVSGGTKTVTIAGGAISSKFSGNLVC